MTGSHIISVSDFKNAPEEDKILFLSGTINKEFVADLINQLEGGDQDLQKMAMIIASRLKLMAAVPALFELINPEKFLNLFGRLDPTTIIIDFGTDAFAPLMSSISDASTPTQLSTASKIIFHWWKNEPEKTSALIKEQAKNGTPVQQGVLREAESQLKQYNG